MWKQQCHKFDRHDYIIVGNKLDLTFVMFDQHVPSGFFFKTWWPDYQIWMFQFRIIVHTYNKDIFYRSNDSSSVNRVTVITVAILLVFIVVLVSVLMVCYVRNQYGFKDKVQQCITGMYSWDVFCTVIVFKESKSVLLLKCILNFHLIWYLWIFWIIYFGIFDLEKYIYFYIVDAYSYL